MKRIACWIIVAVVLFLLAGLACGEGLVPPDAKAPAKSAKSHEAYSFVVITDLHIGYGIPDYYPDYPSPKGADWKDGIQGTAGDDDSQAQTLEGIISQIIREKNNYNIKFVAVLGDISDTAEMSEFLRARQILNRLNDADIVYIPLLGNHDTWPYTQLVAGFDPTDRTKHDTIDSRASGDKLFDDIFWSSSNGKNIQLIKNLFGDSWQKSKNPVNDLANVSHEVYLENYGFQYRGTTFVALDFTPRAKNGDSVNGAAYPGDLFGSIATSHKQTKNFARNYTKNHKSSLKQTVFFSHYSLDTVGIWDYIRSVPEDYEVAYNFAGHQHISSANREYFNLTNTISYEILTEDTGCVETELTKIKPRANKPIRIVQVSSDGTINYDTLLAKNAAPTSVPKTTPFPSATPAPTTPAPSPSKPSTPPAAKDTAPHPIIDGIVNAQEWSSAQSVKLDDNYLLVKNDAANLYILIDAVSDTLDNPPMMRVPESECPTKNCYIQGDYIWISFDVDKDGLIASNIDVSYSPRVDTRDVICRSYYLILPSCLTPCSTSCFDVDAELKTGFGQTINSANTHKFWEISIPLNQIGGEIGGIVRMGVRIYSLNPEFTRDYPSDYWKNTNGFANLMEFKIN